MATPEDDDYRGRVEQKKRKSEVCGQPLPSVIFVKHNNKLLLLRLGARVCRASGCACDLASSWACALPLA